MWTFLILNKRSRDVITSENQPISSERDIKTCVISANDTTLNTSYNLEKLPIIGQNTAIAHKLQHAIKDKPIVNPFKQKNQRSNKYNKTRNTHEPQQQTTTTEYLVPDLGQVQAKATRLNVLIDAIILLFKKSYDFCEKSHKISNL